MCTTASTLETRLEQLIERASTAGVGACSGIDFAFSYPRTSLASNASSGSRHPDWSQEPCREPVDNPWWSTGSVRWRAALSVRCGTVNEQDRRTPAAR